MLWVPRRRGLVVQVLGQPGRDVQGGRAALRLGLGFCGQGVGCLADRCRAQEGRWLGDRQVVDDLPGDPWRGLGGMMRVLFQGWQVRCCQLFRVGCAARARAWLRERLVVPMVAARLSSVPMVRVVASMAAV